MFLGKSGSGTDRMKGMAALSIDEKRSRGAAINQATESQELKDRFARFGMEAVTGNAQQLAALIESDTRRWAPIVRAVGFKAEE